MVLAAGGSLTITVSAEGTTTGQLAVPASVTGGAPLNASMAGTIVVSGRSVTFDQSADSFIRDMTFTADGDTLSGTQTFSGTTVTIVLTRP